MLDLLSFFSILGFGALVFFWYISNEAKGANGHLGIIGLREPDEQTHDGSNSEKAYRQRDAIVPNAQAQQKAFAKRGERHTQNSADKDVHAVRRVKLKAHHASDTPGAKSQPADRPVRKSRYKSSADKAGKRFRKRSR